jgi:hypothetical protein
MTGSVAIALYRPKPGRARELEEILADHVPALRREGLATGRPVLLLRSAVDDTYLEIFEWISAQAPAQADGNEQVMAMRRRIAEIAEVRRLADLAEAGEHLPRFEAVEGLVL